MYVVGQDTHHDLLMFVNHMIILKPHWKLLPQFGSVCVQWG
jgi:hypothetical protein